MKDRETREPAGELGAAITDECVRRGLSMNIVRGMGSSIWRIAPPLTVTQNEIAQALDITDEALNHTGTQRTHG